MKLACKDINPSTTCDFSVEGATAEEAAKAMIAHAKEAHAEDIAGKSDEELTTAFAAVAHE